MSEEPIVDAKEKLFASTSWTVVFDAGATEDSDRSRGALARLCNIYWRPLYLFLRRQGYSSHDAQDYTQGFFEDLIESRAYSKAEPEKGLFRSFLLLGLKRYTAASRKRERTQKRGGGVIPEPWTDRTLAEAERQVRTIAALDAESVFEREWAATLLHRALGRLEEEWLLAGKRNLFESLKSRLADPDETTPDYEDVSQRLGRPLTTLRSDVMRLRARYRDILREEIGSTVDQLTDVDEEIRYLCRVVAGA